jgi:hypothetical protein
MGKNRSASGLTNVIQYDNNGNIAFVSGSTTLMQVSSSGAITTTGVISGSNALSASFSLNSALLNDTGSVGFATTASLLTVSSSQQQISASLLQVSASYISLSGSYNTFSGSNSEILTAVSSSQQQISASLLNVISIGATTGSNSFRATQSITGSLTVTGQIIAQTLNVQQVTSSIIYSSGSNNFGCDLNSRQTFTGSVLITGSLTIAGASSATSYSGTTIYGSTAVCSAVGKFTTCIDAGTGTFSGALTATGGTINGLLTINRNITGLVLNRDAVTNYNGIYYSTAVCSKWFIGMRENLCSNNHIHYSEQLGQDVLTLNVANGAATFSSTITGTTIYGSTAVCSPVGLFSGCVGIGTTNPSYLLHVRCSATSGAPIVGYFQSVGGDAQLHVSNGTITTQLTADNTNSIAIVGSMTNHPLVIRTGNTERMRITYSDGYVGINNCIPLDRLDVAGTIRATVNTSYFTTFGYTGGTQIRMVSPIGETADNMVFKIDGASSGTAGNQFIFQTQVGNTTPVTTLWINKLGDVSIGTTTSTKYQVLNLINDANTVGAAIGLARSSAQFITNAGAGDLIIGNGTGKNILFGNTGAGTTEYMRITSGGTVTKPLQPAFSAGKNTNSTVSAGATVIFQLTTGNKFNIGGHYNASTGIFTAPVAGVYIFSASIIWMNLSNGQTMDDSFWIYKNSSIVAYGLRRAEYEATYTGNGGYFVDFANVLLSLAVGDTVKVVNNRTLEIHGNSEFSYFYGYLLG